MVLSCLQYFFIVLKLSEEFATIKMSKQSIVNNIKKKTKWNRTLFKSPKRKHKKKKEETKIRWNKQKKNSKMVELNLNIYKIILKENYHIA